MSDRAPAPSAELAFAGVAEHARMLAAGEVSARELVELSLQRIEASGLTNSVSVNLCFRRPPIHVFLATQHGVPDNFRMILLQIMNTGTKLHHFAILNVVGKTFGDGWRDQSARIRCEKQLRIRRLR